MQLYEKLDAFVKKMSRWIERVESGNLAMFPSVEEYFDSTDINNTICEHLRKLVHQFQKYFTDSDEWRLDSKWILLQWRLAQVRAIMTGPSQWRKVVMTGPSAC